MNFHIWDRTEGRSAFILPLQQERWDRSAVRQRAEPFIQKPGISMGAGAAGQRSGQVLTFDRHVG